MTHEPRRVGRPKQKWAEVELEKLWEEIQQEEHGTEGIMLPLEYDGLDINNEEHKIQIMDKVNKIMDKQKKKTNSSKHYQANVGVTNTVDFSNDEEAEEIIREIIREELS